MDCSRLGTTLHQDFQRYKKATKMLYFQKDLGDTTACTKRLAIATKGFGQLTSNDNYFSDRCFISVKTAEDMADAGVDYFRLV